MNTFTYRDFKSTKQEELLFLLESIDWSLVEDSDPQEKLACLSTKLMEALDTLSPIKTFILKKRHPAWVDAELLQLYNKSGAVRRPYTITHGDKGLHFPLGTQYTIP